MLLPGRAHRPGFLHTGGATVTLPLTVTLTSPLTSQEHPYDSEQDAIHRRTKLLLGIRD